MTIMPTDMVTQELDEREAPLVLAHAPHVVAKGQDPPPMSGRVKDVRGRLLLVAL